MALSLLHKLLLLWFSYSEVSDQPFLTAALHFCQSHCFFSLWLSALMRSRLHGSVVWGPMVSRETQDNEWITKGCPVERIDFLISLPLPTQTSMPWLFLYSSAFLPVMSPYIKCKELYVWLWALSQKCTCMQGYWRHPSLQSLINLPAQKTETKTREIEKYVKTT